MSLIKLLGTVLTAWQIAARRFGPVGGFVVAAALVTGYVFLKPRLAERAPMLTGPVE